MSPIGWFERCWNQWLPTSKPEINYKSSLYITIFMAISTISTLSLGDVLTSSWVTSAFWDIHRANWANPRIGRLNSSQQIYAMATFFWCLSATNDGAPFPLKLLTEQLQKLHIIISKLKLFNMSKVYKTIWLTSRLFTDSNIIAVINDIYIYNNIIYI